MILNGYLLHLGLATVNMTHHHKYEIRLLFSGIDKLYDSFRE